tara:strand:- start:859 stop:1233 length:375 start_codon:yes stop_codon:yes gene_type:complete
MSTNSVPSNENIQAIIDIGYDLETASNFLKITENNLDMAIGLLLSKPDDTIDVDINLLTNALSKKGDYKIDQSKEIMFHLKKINSDENKVKQALKESNGNYSHAVLILKGDVVSLDSLDSEDSD